MRIGIDCRTILNPGFGEHAGVGHYTYYLVKNLLSIDKKNEYILFFDNLLSQDAARQVTAGNEKVKIVFFPFHKYKHYLPFAFSHILVSAALEKEKLDLFHSPAYTLPMTYKGKSVVTVHDLAIYKHPEWFPEKFLIGQSFSTKTLVPQSLKKAKKIIAVSGHTKKDLQNIFKIKEDKIKVVYEGVEVRNFPDKKEGVCGLENKICFDDLKIKYGLKDNYVLFLGTIEPRKNIEGLVKAFCGLAARNDNFLEKYQLILAGARGFKNEKVLEVVDGFQRKTKKFDIVKYVGYVPPRDKFALIKYADCFAFPSFYEGFGLPVLEALSLGVPTITSDSSSMPEIAGGAAVLINPGKTESIAAAIKEVIFDRKLRREMSKKGMAQASKFSWKKCAEETLAVYGEIFKK